MDLFDVTTGFQGTTGRGASAECPPARTASVNECNAYLRWLASRDGIEIPTGAKFTDAGITIDGELIVAMPGYGDTRRAVMEVVDDGGQVIRSTPIAVDAKGYMTLSKAQVLEASGLTPIKAKRGKAAKPAPIAVAQPVEIPASEAQETQETAPATPEAVETPDALHGADLAPAEPATETDELPAPATVKESVTVDPIAQIEARLAAVEAALAALPAESKADPAPTMEARPRRTAAHERAIRRAWAERRAARLQRDIAADHLRMREQVQDELRTLSAERDCAIADAAAWKASSDDLFRAVERTLGKRLATAQRARRMIATARADARHQAQLAAAAQAELARLKRDLADPTQPERASDIARLVKDRDQARAAVAALQGRAERAEQARDMLADKFEEMVGRVARAEAAVRKLVA